MNDTLIIKALEGSAERRSERREFFRRAGGLAAGAAAAAGAALVAAREKWPAAAALAAGGEVQAQQMLPMSDTDILNFALNFEYLEGNFYNYIVNGAPIDASLTTGVGTLGAATGGRAHTFDDPVVGAYARQLVNDETGHIKFLRSQLGSAAVAQPAIDLGTSPTSAFSVAAQMAGAVPAGQPFDPYASDVNFLLAAFLFVEVGTSAYQGAAGLLTSNLYLDAAAGILAVEAYHSGIARTLIYNKGIALPMDANNPINLTVGISNARDSLDGPTDDDQGLIYNGAPNFVPTDANSLTFPRTTAQVLNIGYLNAMSVTKGGFFPNGVNGAVNTSGANG